MEPAYEEVCITRWEGPSYHTAVDRVAAEEPLEIRVEGESVSVTMRTPGDDFALAAGFLFTEGILESGDAIGAMGYCTDPSEHEEADLRNIVNVHLTDESRTGWQEARALGHWRRNFTSTSSCGLCGKASIESVLRLAPALQETGFRVPAAVIQALPDRMRAGQRTFQRTGGLHAAGLFDARGRLIGLREDIGRHNAVDKLIGSELLADRPILSERVLLVSGRTSFEIIQKAAVARIPVICAVSAPSSLAVQLATSLRITLVGFLRGETMNVYSCPGRITDG